MSHGLRRTLVILILSIPLIWYGTTLMRFARDIPIADDYDVALRFLCDTQVSPGFHLFFQQHNEHRLVVPRAVIYLIYIVSGQVNFRLLALIANIWLVATFLILWLIWQKRSYPLWLFLPVPFLIFSPLNWKNMVWITSGLQNYGVIALASAAFYSIESSRKTVNIFAVVCGFMAMFTSLSGILVLPLLTIRAIKRFKDTSTAVLLVCYIMSLSAFGSFLFGYRVVRSQSAMMFGFRHLVEMLCHYLIQLGGSMRHPTGAWFLGCMIIILTVLVAFLKVWHRAPIIWNIHLFLLLNAAMISVGRVHFGFKQSLSPRYATFSLLLVVSLYCLLLAAVRSRHVAWHRITGGCFAGFAVLIFICHLSPSMALLQEHDVRLTSGLVAWSTGGQGLIYPNQAGSSALLLQSIRLNCYRPPVALPVCLHKEKTDKRPFINQHLCSSESS